MRKVELSLKENYKYKTIKKLVETNDNKERARIQLGLKSIRLINRLIAGYKKYGIPYLFKTDKRTVFEYNKKGTTSDEDNTFTQFAYSCSQLGTSIETSSVPQFNPRIERLFESFQLRLIPELRLANISTIEEANNFLPTFLKRYNSKFTL